MSGTVFLEEVISWDDEKRKDKVEEALPQLIQHLQNHRSHDEAIGILQIVCQAFVPLVPQKDLERKVFSCISQQINGLLDAVLEDVHRTVQQNQDSTCEQLIALLQHVSGVLECVEDCVKHVVNLPDTVQVSQVRSLLHCSLHALKGSYGHCQESSQLYGDGLPPLSDSLSGIFRRAHSLQMAFLNMLEKMKVISSAPDTDIRDITHVCEELFSLCRLVACLELRLTVSLWKALSKLLVQHQERVCGRLEISTIMSYLCEEIHSGIQQLLDSAPPTADQEEVMLSQGDDKAFTKSLKILNFQLKVLVAIVKDCHGYLGACIPNICNLMVYLNSILPPSLSATKLQSKHEGMVRQQLCYSMQPLTSHLLTSAAFRECVLLDESDEHCLPRLLLQLAVMNSLSFAPVDVMVQWLEKMSAVHSVSPSIFSSTFKSLEKCHIEICLPVYLPGTANAGKPPRTISLYQYAVEHICGFIGSCPAKLFHVAEEQLLNALLNPNPISTQVAADCWCFMTRYGTADLCLQHAQFLLGVCKEVKSRAPLSYAVKCVTSLVGRLIKFLSPEQQVDLLASFPAASNVTLWSDINLSGLSESPARETVHALAMSALRSVQSFCQRSNPTVADAVDVIPSLKCLHNVVRHETTSRHLTPQLGASILSSVASLWQAWPMDQPLPPLTTASPTGQGVCHLHLAALVMLTSEVADQLDAKLLLQVLVMCQKAVNSPCLSEVTMAVVQLLAALGPVRLPPSFEQGQILRKIADTFATVLSHESAIVQHSALVAFTRFAEQTAYEAVVPECLAQKEGLQEKVTAFLQKVPYSPDSQNLDAVSYLQQQRERFRAKMSAMYVSASTLKSSLEITGPRKRLRMADNTDMDEMSGYQAAVEDLEAVVARMERLNVKGPMPEWVVARSKPLLHRLAACLNNR